MVARHGSIGRIMTAHSLMVSHSPPDTETLVRYGEITPLSMTGGCIYLCGPNKGQRVGLATLTLGPSAPMLFLINVFWYTNYYNLFEQESRQVLGTLYYYGMHSIVYYLTAA